MGHDISSAGSRLSPVPGRFPQLAVFPLTVRVYQIFADIHDELMVWPGPASCSWLVEQLYQQSKSDCALPYLLEMFQDHLTPLLRYGKRESRP